MTWNPHLKLSNFPRIQRQFIWCTETLISAYLVGFLSLHLQLPSSKTISLFILIKIHGCSSSHYHRNRLKLFFFSFFPRSALIFLWWYDCVWYRSDPLKNMHQNFNQVNHKNQKTSNFSVSSKLMLYQAPQKVELCSSNHQSTIFFFYDHQSTIFLMVYRQLICFLTFVIWAVKFLTFICWECKLRHMWTSCNYCDWSNSK